MKTCTKCKQTKSETEYFVRDKTSNRLHAQCKSCYTVQRRETYAAHYQKYGDIYRHRAKLRRQRQKEEYRQNMYAYLQGKVCADCGEDDVVVFELDHVNPADKKFTISQAVKLGYSWNDVLIELKKCQIVCANCHKRRTAQQ